VLPDNPKFLYNLYYLNLVAVLFYSSLQRYDSQLGLFRITKAAIIPGTQPHSVNKKTITKEPQPLPITDKGGKIIASKTLSKLIDY
jgi:hypothetical protein